MIFTLSFYNAAYNYCYNTLLVIIFLERIILDYI